MFTRLIYRTGALCAFAIATFAASLTVLSGPTLASGQYCDGPYVSIERQDLSPEKVRENCEAAADFLRQAPIVRGKVCALCAPEDVKTVGNTLGQSTGGPIKAPVVDEPDRTPPNPLPAGIEIVRAGPLKTSCAQPPTDYLLRISSSSNCPKGYITRGKERVDGKFLPDVRWCAVCPGGYSQTRLDRFKCCIPDTN